MLTHTKTASKQPRAPHSEIATLEKLQENASPWQINPAAEPSGSMEKTPWEQSPTDENEPPACSQ
jgi:hypothetical protein